METRSPARKLWEAIEPIHDVVYFHPGPTDALKQLGLRGWWMCYFAGRFAPVGAVEPQPATAMAFGFAPGMVARSLPDAWTFAAPDAVVAARLESVSAALRTTLPAASAGTVGELDDLLTTAVSACRYEGRPLAAGWSGIERPDDPLARLWALTTVLREHRGDGHVIAATALGLSGLETSLTHVATGAVRRDGLQPNRGWTDEEWDAATQRLKGRGLLDRDGRLTEDGSARRGEIEAMTDRLAEAPVDALGEDGVDRVVAVAGPLSRHLVDTGVVPVPNPIGAPRPS